MVPPADSGQYFRESTRAPLNLEVTLQVDAFKQPETARTGNVSLGGMFIEFEEPLPVGTIVKFELHFEPPHDVVEGTAEVVWIRPDRVSAEKPAGIGLQFRHLKEDGDAIVRGAIEEILQAQGLTVEAPVIEKPKPRPKPRRPRPLTAPAATTARRPQKAKKKKKEKRQKASTKSAGGSKGKDGAASDEKRKLIMAIVLIAVLLYVLSRTFG